MQTDFLIIGSGIAGLSLALKLSTLGEVMVLTKGEIDQTSTALAQGGIAAVSQKQDSFKKHFADTLKAGDFLNKKSSTLFLVKNAFKAVQFLKEIGVKFNKSLHLEGGHSKKRIFHVDDKTGFFIEKKLIEKVKKNKNIKVLHHCFVIDLLYKNNCCNGVSAFYQGKIINFLAQKIILATGGGGQIFAKTTAPLSCTGDGLAMALRAKVKVSHLEFIQFHPTAFDFPLKPVFLLSEALRGEGALLINEKGERFTYELDSRDKVSQAIFKQKKAFLDFTHENKSKLQEKFPAIFKKLLQKGFDLSKDKIPIIPVAHFFCGGIVVDIYGQTNLKNLFAVGEVACTGVHGANRLASNSLCEAVVFAESIYQTIKNNFKKEKLEIDFPITKFHPENSLDQKIRQEIQLKMSRFCSIVRDFNKMKKILKEFEALHPQGTETSNILQVAKEVLRVALKRKKSAGCHFVIS